MQHLVQCPIGKRVSATNDYVEDVGILFHGVDAGGTLPASNQIDSYDVMVALAPDPGRERSRWSVVQKVPYNDAAILADTVAVPCGAQDQNVVLAIGLTFNTDATLGIGIESEYVGAASVPIACSPNLADPDAPKVRRPAAQQERQHREHVGLRGR